MVSDPRKPLLDFHYVDSTTIPLTYLQLDPHLWENILSFPTCKLYFFLHASGDNGCKIDNDLFQYSCHYFHPTILCILVNSKCIASKLAQVWLHNNSSYFHMHHQKL
jgi:hypothetical protein